MAETKKMGLETTIEEIEKLVGGWPATQMSRVIVPIEQVNQEPYKLRKRPGVEGQTHCIIAALGVGQAGQQLRWFFGYKFIDAAKKAYDAMRGL